MISFNTMIFLRSVLLLFFFVSRFSCTSASLTREVCLPDQRDALLEFKNEFEIRYPVPFLDLDVHGDFTPIEVTSFPKTKSWGNNSDCCHWDGITCDTNSGVVIGLDLSCSCLYGPFKRNSSSLFRLRHLRNLNLAYNNFTFSPIPKEFNKLMGLKILNLSYSWFYGQIPTEILHLTKLVSLDLSSVYDVFPNFYAESPFLHLLSSNLTSLEELDMSDIDIGEIPQNILNLTSLRSLHLRQCNLFGRVPRLSHSMQSIDLSDNQDLEVTIVEFTRYHSLVKLDLSFAPLSSNIPDTISNLRHLNYLRLRYCDLFGKIPSSVGNLSHLTFLDLSSNDLTGEVPSSIGNLNQLTILNIGDNKLSGRFPIFVLNLTKLTKLRLNSNQFTNTLPPNMSSLSNLEYFEAGDNAFTGTLPSSLFRIPSLRKINLVDNQLTSPLDHEFDHTPSSLKILYLANNKFKGPIPRSISKLVHLQRLDLSNFNTGTTIDFSIFSYLKSLEELSLSHLNTTRAIDLDAILLPLKSLSTLDLSGNHISSASMNSVSYPPLQLTYLNLSGCGIKGQVPSWLWSLPELQIVDLSNNIFSGFHGFTKDFPRGVIMLLDLRSNDFQGPLFVPPRPIINLLASRNNFSGETPISICGMTSLEILDLSNNNLSGSVPHCLENLIERSLSVLSLGNNHFSGILPEIFTNGTNLRSVNVGHNNFVGKLPRSFAGCTSLEVLNVEHNRFNDTFPFWLQPLTGLKVLVLRSNEFHGSLQPPNVSSGFLQLRIIDVSHNGFMGTLESDFFMWRAMFSKKDSRVLDYFGNIYYMDSLDLMNKGVEAKMEVVVTLLTAMDISGNKLRGQIPESIGLLKGLIVLNLSNNHFEGHVPSSMANLTELESLDLSQNMISGTIPPQLVKLTFVQCVDFSHNKLIGMIPRSTQFETQNPSRFQDNVGLCGPPLDECGVFHEPPPSQELEDEEEEEEQVLSWIAAAIGVAPGIVFGLTIGHIAISYKPHWFFKVFYINNHRRRRSR